MSSHQNPSRRAFLRGVAIAVPASSVAVSSAAALLAPVAETLPSVPATSAEAVPNPDAELLRLVDEYVAAKKEYRRLARRREREYDKHEAANPMPDVLMIREEDVELGIPESLTRLERAEKYKGESCCALMRSYNDLSLIKRLEEPKWPIYEESSLIDTDDSHGVLIRRGAPSLAAGARADEIIAAYREWRPRSNRMPLAYRLVARECHKLAVRLDRMQGKIVRTPARSLAGIIAKAKAVASARATDRDWTHSDESHDILAASIARDLQALDGRAQS
jgi:hypothetical protein